MKNVTKNINVSKKQLAYEFMREQIVNGTYGPGQRIVIDQIAKELSLSIIPVREAIRQLEADDLIVYKPYSGAIVSNINEKEYGETLSVLAVLEGYATALSSMVFPKTRIPVLQNINKNMHEALYDFEFEQFGLLNRDFHTLIYEYCGNDILTDQIRQVWERLSRVRRSGFTFVPQRAKESIKEHDVIIDMIRERSSIVEIEQFVRQHKMNTVLAFQNRENVKNRF
jgi:DNA-binding GntR family transcriptional regulator